MKPIERIAIYLEFKSITPHAFEKRIKLSNGYFSKQLRNQGSVGSDILIKIYEHYSDINMLWVLTGEGEMLKVYTDPITATQVNEFAFRYESENSKLKNLENDLEKMNIVVKDKEKIISLYEFMMNMNASNQNAFAL